MAKRKTKAKRSLASLPKGLPQKKGSSVSNPFETSSRSKKPKFQVHNRFNQKDAAPSKLALALQRRQGQVRKMLQEKKKSGAFVDRRIGEYTPGMSESDQNLARLVRERSMRSKRSAKYALDDDDEGNDSSAYLTHKGKSIDRLTTREHVILSSDDEADGDLDALDTEFHFGGGADSSKRQAANPYGVNTSARLTDVYSQRKTELDDMIARKKYEKAERQQSKEKQVEAFEQMDKQFKELSQLLQFRDKQSERKEREDAKRNKIPLSPEDEEMEAWNREMKSYLFDRRVKAEDRTKTPEEIAKEEAERLHELETRRLARMNGDFHEDDFSDISDDDEAIKRRDRKKTKKSKRNASKMGRDNPEALDDDDEDDDDDSSALEPRFTSEGLVYVDKHGNVTKKGEGKNDSATSDDSAEEHYPIGENDRSGSLVPISVGTKVQANYHAYEQFDGGENWYSGVVRNVHEQKNGTLKYDVDYDDGDFEENVDHENVRSIAELGTNPAKQTKEEKMEQEAGAMKRKRQKAKDKARTEIPFVFEVPTTLDALHDIIGAHAESGKDASLIIERIHKSNSARLDRRNLEKMQNFYDVLLRRFMAIGDAIFLSGHGGEELGRYQQLDALTQVLYSMSQDSPSSCGAVWNRRLGILQNAHAKRLRDVFHDDVDADEDCTAWPSTGTIMLLRAVGHIFPTTDLRHPIVTPTLLFLGQILTQTPIRSLYDVCIGLTCSGLMIEFTKESFRVAPEAVAFLAGILTLFADDEVNTPNPALEQARKDPALQSLQQDAAAFRGADKPRLCLEKSFMDGNDTAAAILLSTLELLDFVINVSTSRLGGGETAYFDAVRNSLHALSSREESDAFPEMLSKRIADTSRKVGDLSSMYKSPLSRRSGPTRAESAIKSLAPRLEDYSRYSMSKDKGKSAKQATLDRARREYKREHKAVSRELRLDAAMVERAQREAKSKRDQKARAKRNANFVWLEGEQATMNQQVKQGGGLLSGGGSGAAKLRSRKLGMKKKRKTS